MIQFPGNLFSLIKLLKMSKSAERLENSLISNLQNLIATVVLIIFHRCWQTINITDLKGVISANIESIE